MRSNLNRLINISHNDYAGSRNIKRNKRFAKNITQQYGTPDLCIEAMRKRTWKRCYLSVSWKQKRIFRCRFNHEVLFPFV